MNDTTRFGPWVRRFLLEHLVSERNLARNTQRSYRDTIALLVPFIAGKVRKHIDELDINHVSAENVQQFLQDLEETRRCSVTTRNQRLAVIHALAHFIGQHCPEHIEWCGQLRAIPFKRTPKTSITYLKSQRWMRCSLRPIATPLKDAATTRSCSSYITAAPARMRRHN
jgi:site-specific recombinase XerD